MDIGIIASNGRYSDDKATYRVSAGMLAKLGIEATRNARRLPLYQKLCEVYKTGTQEGTATYYMGFSSGGSKFNCVLRGRFTCDGAWRRACQRRPA